MSVSLYLDPFFALWTGLHTLFEQPTRKYMLIRQGKQEKKGNDQMNDNQLSFQYLLVFNFLQDRTRVTFMLIGIVFIVKSSRY